MSLKAIPLLLMLGATVPRGADGYRMEDSRFYAKRQISVEVHEDRESMLKAYGKNPPANLAAFAKWNNYRCTIHIIDPARRYKPETYGHELVHCLYGDFHPSQHKPGQ